MELKEQKNYMIQFLNDILNNQGQGLYFEEKKKQNAKDIEERLAEILKVNRLLIEDEIDKMVNQIDVILKEFKKEINFKITIFALNSKMKDVTLKIEEKIKSFEIQIKEKFINFEKEIKKMNEEFLKLKSVTVIKSNFLSNDINFADFPIIKKKNLFDLMIGIFGLNMSSILMVGGVLMKNRGIIVFGLIYFALATSVVSSKIYELNEYNVMLLKQKIKFLRKELKINANELKNNIQTKFDKIHQIYKVKVIPYIDLIKVDR